MTQCSVIDDIETHISSAAKRYGPFASTHEAMGVALEEWSELQDAVHANNLESVAAECIDLAAVLVRLARDLRDNQNTRNRSRK